MRDGVSVRGQASASSRQTSGLCIEYLFPPRHAACRGSSREVHAYRYDHAHMHAQVLRIPQASSDRSCFLRPSGCWRFRSSCFHVSSSLALLYYLVGYRGLPHPLFADWDDTSYASLLPPSPNRPLQRCPLLKNKTQSSQSC